MSDLYSPDPTSAKDKAKEFFDRAERLKTEGRTDAALTEYRRAVLADPAHAAAHLAIGWICKAKASKDRMFARYAFDAFRHAARLDIANQDAHNQYIMAAQQMNLLDDLHSEYDAWCKQFPDNAFLQQCKKNIVTLTMAMIPADVNVDTGGISMRRMVLLGSIVLMMSGALMILGAPILNKIRPNMLTGAQIKTMVTAGLATSGVGIGGFFIRARMK